MDIEICVESLAEVEMAVKHGAKRVELCSALDLGGFTPSMGLVGQAALQEEVEVHVLIRPRSGNFEYSEDELEVIEQDIRLARKYGAKGVVFGILKNGEIDVEENGRLRELASLIELETTFHRAFDIVEDPIDALKQLIDMGFDRLLTSGQKPSAIEGIELIKYLVKEANGAIEIMPGGGVSDTNAVNLMEAAVDAIHFSARKVYSEESLGMGVNYQPNEEKVEAILKSLTLNQV